MKRKPADSENQLLLSLVSDERHATVVRANIININMASATVCRLGCCTQVTRHPPSSRHAAYHGPHQKANSTSTDQHQGQRLFHACTIRHSCVCIGILAGWSTTVLRMPRGTTLLMVIPSLQDTAPVQGLLEGGPDGSPLLHCQQDTAPLSYPCTWFVVVCGGKSNILII